MMFDGKAFGEEIVGMVRDYVEQQVAPLKAEHEHLRSRLQTIEDRPLPEVIKGDPGESIEPEAVAEMVAEQVAKAVDALPKAQDGKDAAGIVEALKDNGELVLTLGDGRLIRTGIHDGRDAEAAADAEDWAEGLTLEEKAALASAMLRKEIGDADLIVLPDPLPVSAARPQERSAVEIHNHLPKRGLEKTIVTKHDERGRILEFERREV